VSFGSEILAQKPVGGWSANRKLDALTSILKPSGCVSVKVLPDMLFLSYCRSVEQGFRRLTVARVFLS
jgi:hypothetical protein